MYLPKIPYVNRVLMIMGLLIVGLVSFVPPAPLPALQSPTAEAAGLTRPLAIPDNSTVDHRTGAFHSHLEFTEFGPKLCLYGPSGSTMFCEPL